jgi:sugar/nucleoside kinase (ribokinase family)
MVEGPAGVYTEVDVPPVADVIDTTGAGDAMAGGFLAAWAAGADAVAACEVGHAQAAMVITQAGARVPLVSK